MATRTPVTLNDLYTLPENRKAELIEGEIRPLSPTGGLPNRAGGNLFVSLKLYERRYQNGFAVTDNAGFHVDLPHRQSFSPDAAFYRGPTPTMRFFEGAPVFAVEVRSEYDTGPQAEQEMARKRADYFAAGTLVVWDIDLQSEVVVRKFTSDRPEAPILFRRGESADAEPALRDWSLAVDELFD